MGNSFRSACFFHPCLTRSLFNPSVEIVPEAFVKSFQVQCSSCPSNILKKQIFVVSLVVNGLAAKQTFHEKDPKEFILKIKNIGMPLLLFRLKH